MGGFFIENMNKFERKPFIIAGPCSAEPGEQIQISAREGLKRNIDAMRVSLWKPRTEPGGFEGLGEEGLPLLLMASQMGITPATEVMLPQHAERVIDTVIKHSSDAKVIVWLGSRNQNQLLQREIGRVVAGEPRVILMIKNQPWRDERHWKGIAGFAIEGGASHSQIMMIHRGFAPTGIEKDGLRNPPDFEMAMRVKRETNLPMIIDPSHIGGSVENVMRIAKDALDYENDGLKFDGLMVEVHPNPETAATDKKQQLTWDQFDQILEYGKVHR